ncbi:MAG TPA: ribosomal protein S18-alanine N-acetyltransferase [Terriglobales bacterium]|nr:ribosomal protein S18-alanine N-acetyltransferase [Terriglobales bacterium]
MQKSSPSQDPDPEPMVSIRIASRSDIAAMLALERAAETAAHWSEPQYQQIFSAPGRLALVAESDAIEGFLVARQIGPEWELENIVVSSAAARRGRATRLITELLERARAEHAEAIFLEVRESNRPARALYEKCGFRQVGLRQGYYRGPEENAVAYKYSLIPRSLRSK